MYIYLFIEVSYCMLQGCSRTKVRCILFKKVYSCGHFFSLLIIYTLVLCRQPLKKFLLKTLKPIAIILHNDLSYKISNFIPSNIFQKFLVKTSSIALYKVFFSFYIGNYSIDLQYDYHCSCEWNTENATVKGLLYETNSILAPCMLIL